MNLTIFIPIIEIFTFISLFGFILNFIIKFIKKHNINKKFLFILISMKIFFLVGIYFYGLLGNAVDAKSIYDMSTIFFDKIYNNISYRVFFGSDFLSILMSPFTNFGQLRYFNTSILFMMLGLLSSLLFYVVLKKYSKNKYHEILSMIIVLYPTLNLFTSFITKDLIIFFLLTSLLFIINFELKNKYFNIKLFFIILGIALIRPYVFIVLTISTITVFILLHKFKKPKELIFSTLSIGFISVILFILFYKIYTQIFTGNGNFLEQIYYYLSDRAHVTNIGSTKINLNNLSFVGKIYNVIFGPTTLTFNFSSIFFLIDKLYLFFILVHLLIVKVKLTKIKIDHFKLFEFSLLFYAILLCFLISLSVSNYGIGLRLKLMFLPIFFYFILKNQKNYNFQKK